MLSSSPELDDLQILLPDRFDLEERLGSGASGVVFRAFDAKHQTCVALKTLHALEAERVYRFKREFRSLADISHPNLVDLYELIADDDVWFFTMSYVEGRDFRTALRDGPLGGEAPLPDAPTADLSETGTSTRGRASTIDRDSPPPTVDGPPHDPKVPAPTDDLPRREDDAPEANTDGPPSAFDAAFARRTLVGVATGVRALHAYGKLHRDLKPDNVLVTDPGRAVILDFGLVTELQPGANGSPGEDENAGITGTPRYLPPEMARDEPLGEPADWYSLGVMLYEVLAGRAPIQADNPLQELFQKNNEPPTDVRQLAGDAPEDLCELCMDMLAIDPNDRPHGREILERLGADPPPRREAPRLNSGGPNRTPFVGRNNLLRRLRELADRTVAEAAPTVVDVHGESGVGKTTLVEEFLARFRDDHPEAIVLSGRCYENESVPYKALDGIIDELIPWLEEMPDERLEELLGDGAAALAQLFPVLRRVEVVFEADTGFRSLSETQLRDRAFRTLPRLLHGVASSRPLLMFIDDVQWGDEDSVRLLAHILNSPDPPPMMLLTTWRGGDVETSSFLEPYLEMRDQLGDAVAVDPLPVSELDPDEARDMAEQLVGEWADDPRAAAEDRLDLDKVARESGGNPLFIDELSRQMTRDGSIDSDITDLDHVLHDRIDRLPDPTRRLLEVVALAGQPLDRQIVRRVADTPSEDLSHVSTLKSRRLVRIKGTDGNRLVPYHDHIRRAVDGRLPEADQREIHRELARTFETTDRADPETIGTYYARAGDELRAADHFVEAADRAAEALAFERVCELLELALEYGDWEADGRHDLLRRLGDAHAALGEGEDAAAAYRQAAEATDGLDACESRIDAAEQLLRAGEFEAGNELLYEQLESLGFSPTRSRTGMMLSTAYRRWQVERRGFQFDREFADTAPRRERLLIDALAKASNIFGVTDVLKGSYFHFHALPRALDGGLPRHVADLLIQQIGQDAAMGRHPERTKRLLEIAGELLPQCRDDRTNTRGFWWMMDGMVDYFDGDWSTALSSFQQAIQEVGADTAGYGWETQIFRFFEAECLQWLGDLEGLRDRIPRYLEEADDRKDSFHSVLFRAKAALLSLLDGDADRAGHQIEEASEEWTREGYHIQHFRLYYARIRTAMYRGDSERAWQIASDGWGRLRRSPVGHVQPVRILAWAARGRTAAARARETSGWHRWRARLATWRARRALDSMEMEGSDAFAASIAAQIAVDDDDRDRAAERWREADRLFDQADMTLHAVTTRLRWTRLSRAPDVDETHEQALDWMYTRGIAKPDAIARTIAGLAPALDTLPA